MIDLTIHDVRRIEIRPIPSAISSCNTWVKLKILSDHTESEIDIFFKTESDAQDFIEQIGLEIPVNA